MRMIENFVKTSYKKLTVTRPIPHWLLFISFLAFIFPIVQEILTPNNFDWVWFLYIIPATVCSYYLGTSLKILTVIVLSGAILFSEYYSTLYLEKGNAEQDVAIALGVILSMIIASMAVAIIAEEIQIARKSWELISETTDMAIKIVDKEDKLAYFNKAFAKLMNVKQKETLGNYDSDTEYEKDLTRTLVLEESFVGKEYLESITNSNERVLLGDTFVLRGEGKKIIGAMLTVQDITEQKLMEAKIRQAEKFKVLGQMAAGLAHEIRNPLTSIRGFLQLRCLRGEDQSEKGFIQIMLEEIDRVNKLLSEFLVLAKQVPPRKELHSLKTLLTKVVALISSEATLMNITVRINVPELLPLLAIDSEQIKQVIINVTQNAMEAMPKGGTLDIHVLNQYGQVKIYLTDTGDGIDSRILNKIYDPFYTTKEAGTGLGLSLCQRIIENHAGKFELDSIVGEGTKVTITLPIVKVA